MIPHGLISALDIILVFPVLLGFYYRKTLVPTMRTLWFVLVGVIVLAHGALLAAQMWGNVVALREEDFLGFFIDAHVAGAGQNFYDPSYGQELARQFSVSDGFRREILNVGFWYPPISMFVFLPLAAFTNAHQALMFWYVLQTLALLGAIAVLARSFFRSDGASGVATVAALALLSPATSQVFQYGQSTFIALLVTALFWDTRRSATGGMWLALATCVKPFVGILGLVLVCRRRLKPLAGATATIAIVTVITLVAFGVSTFNTYFNAHPDSRIPAFVFGETANQSLLGLVLRLTHGIQGEHLSHISVTTYSAIAAILTAATIWLCCRHKGADDQVLLSLTLSLALLIYPTSLTHYAVFLIIPALVMWSRRSPFIPAWAIAAGISLTYALMIINLSVVATLISWVAFALLALPPPMRASVAKVTSNALRLIRNFAKPDQPAYSTALGLGFVAVAVVLTITIQNAIRPERSYFHSTGTDFRAFYCAGKAANAKADPYRVEPLRGCEHRVQPARGWSDESVLPAPLPGYDVAFFAVLARFPYVTMKALWDAIIITSVLLSVFFLTRLTRFPALLILLGLSLTDGFQSFGYGQLPAVAVAALSAAAFFLQRRSYVAAAFIVGASMIEPHLGLPACLSMFIWLRQTRMPLVIVASILAAAGLSALGAVGNAEYLFHVLPQHAAAELVATDQYALSHLLHIAGLSDRTALAIGSASYIVMVSIGVKLARSAATSLKLDALIILVPPAAALLGGTFIHGTQFATALPAAFLLLSAAPNVETLRKASWALALLVVPWDILASAGLRAEAIIVVSLSTLIWLSYTASPNASMTNRSITAAACTGTFVTALLILHYLPESGVPLIENPRLPASVLVANADASANWSAYLRYGGQSIVPSFRSELAKLPNWLAIALLLSAVFSASRRQSLKKCVVPNPTDVPLTSIHGR